MTALSIIQSLIAPIWRLFTAFGGGTGYRSGQSRNPKISDERKGDEL